MDYCHQCRRHLNGALACAGCGTPAEELRYFSPHPSSPPQALTEPADTLPPVAPEFSYELDPVEPPRPTGGRAAARRRNQRADRKGGRRGRSRGGRAVLFGALGVALAAGSLSLAKAALEPSVDDGAATAVQEDDVSRTTLDPAPPAPAESTRSSDGPAPVDSGSPRPVNSGHATRGSGRGTGSGDGSEAGTGTGTGSGTGTSAGGGTGPPPSGTAGPGDATPSGAPSGTASPSASGTASGPRTGTPAPGGDGPSGSPSPSPTPTKACTPFLWWCV
ncbi:SCO2400 family protein [Streptomyces sp. NPDC003943]